MLIGGEWGAATPSQEIEVVNPATEEVVGTVPSGDATDVDLAVATAGRAFADWSRTDAEARAHILARAADLIEERAADVAAVLTSEQGKPLAAARGEATHPAPPGDGHAARRGPRRGHAPRARRALLRRGRHEGHRHLPGAAVDVRPRLRA